MTEFRKIKESEIANQRLRYAEKYPWAPEPAWPGVYVLLRDGSIKGMFGLQQKFMVEPMDADDPRTVRSLMDRADTLLMGVDYEFFVPNQNKQFQDFLESQEGLEGQEELPGKYYLIKRDRD